MNFCSFYHMFAICYDQLFFLSPISYLHMIFSNVKLIRLLVIYFIDKIWHSNNNKCDKSNNDT